MKNLNTEILSASIKTAFTRDRFMEIVEQYKAYVNNSLALRKEPMKKPCCDQMELYVMYVLLKGRNPECTTHCVESEKYEQALSNIKSYLVASSTSYSHTGWNAFNDHRVLLDKAIGLTDEEKLALSAALLAAQA
ncbi:hypothetical protein LMH73_012410 [Vibrio splendidus]|nr:hypothetical protein [Vibrio splendidus]MCC4880703.1 hypothetical protein [Vibrio splendidus]